MLMLIFKGIVGVLGVSFVVLFVILGMVGILVEGFVFIVGIDCILDMVCIVVNVVGNSFVVVVMSCFEGEFDDVKFW